MAEWLPKPAAGRATPNPPIAGRPIRRHPEPETEPTNDPNPAAKATLAASIKKRFERIRAAGGLPASAAGSGFLSSPLFATITTGRLATGKAAASFETGSPAVAA